jgi:hypothetical protein
LDDAGLFRLPVGEGEAMRDTIDMAREAGGDDWGLFKDFMPEIERLVALVRADEREQGQKWFEAVTKEEALQAIKLLSALEVWAMSQSARLPDYVHEDLCKSMEVLERIVLEKQA